MLRRQDGMIKSIVSNETLVRQCMGYPVRWD
jgi:hypothetical protein